MPLSIVLRDNILLHIVESFAIVYGFIVAYLFLFFKSVFTFMPCFQLEIGLCFGWEYGIIGENEMQSFRHMNQI